MKNKIFILLAIILCFSVMTVYAVELDPNFGGEAGKISAIASRFLGIIQWFGYAIAIGMLIYIGIKYVTTSAEGKADMKSAMVKYIIGAIFIAGAASLSTIILTMFGSTYS